MTYAEEYGWAQFVDGSPSKRAGQAIARKPNEPVTHPVQPARLPLDICIPGNLQFVHRQAERVFDHTRPAILRTKRGEQRRNGTRPAVDNEEIQEGVSGKRDRLAAVLLIAGRVVTDVVRHDAGEQGKWVGEGVAWSLLRPDHPARWPASHRHARRSTLRDSESIGCQSVPIVVVAVQILHGAHLRAAASAIPQQSEGLSLASSPT